MVHAASETPPASQLSGQTPHAADAAHPGSIRLLASSLETLAVYGAISSVVKHPFTQHREKLRDCSPKGKAYTSNLRYLDIYSSIVRMCSDPSSVHQSIQRQKRSGHTSWPRSRTIVPGRRMYDTRHWKSYRVSWTYPPCTICLPTVRCGTYRGPQLRFVTCVRFARPPPPRLCRITFCFPFAFNAPLLEVRKAPSMRIRPAIPRPGVPPRGSQLRFRVHP
jgi:hypothetical protein